ncbi:MAG: Rpn family recombination-promoting nuclease/putative transposase [Synergistaceae bacterium]|nr:Rpn family recombination-promoting nuclease/putative transposase [Synergistaceae bacterium]
MLDLINSIFGTLGYQKLKTIELLNTEMTPDSHKKKRVHFDLRGVDENGRQVNVELQKELHAHFVSRCLFHWGKNYTQQLDAGKGFSNLKPTIMVSLLGSNMFKDDELSVWDFVLINPRTGKILTQDELLIYVEMEKVYDRLKVLRDKIKTTPDYEFTEAERVTLWSGYIRNVEIGVEIVNQTAQKDQVFHEVIEAESSYWSNPENRYAQFMEQIAELDARAFLEDAEERGIQQGSKQEKEKTARAMLENGIKIELVSKITELSIEELKRL